MSEKKDDHEHQAKPEEKKEPIPVVEAKAEEASPQAEPSKPDFENLFYDLVELLQQRASALPVIEGLADIVVQITSKRPTLDTTVNHIMRAIKSTCNQVRRFQGDLQVDLAMWLEQRKVDDQRPERHT